MKKLMFIAIIIFGLGITSVFGQDFDHNPRPKSVRNAKFKKPDKSKSYALNAHVAVKGKRVQPGNSGGTISNQRSSRTRKSALNPFLGELDLALNIKKSRTQKSVTTTQKRQHKPY